MVETNPREIAAGAVAAAAAGAGLDGAGAAGALVISTSMEPMWIDRRGALDAATLGVCAARAPLG